MLFENYTPSRLFGSNEARTLKKIHEENVHEPTDASWEHEIQCSGLFPAPVFPDGTESKCPICLDDPMAAPKLMQCGHVICDICFYTHYEHRRFYCPICREPIHFFKSTLTRHIYRLHVYEFRFRSKNLTDNVFTRVKIFRIYPADCPSSHEEENIVIATEQFHGGHHRFRVLSRLALRLKSWREGPRWRINKYRDPLPKSEIIWAPRLTVHIYPGGRQGHRDYYHFFMAAKY